MNFVWDDGRWRLDDGQHRCQAIIDTGISARVMIVFGGDPRGVDLGRARTYAQELTKRGGINSTTAKDLASSAKAILTWNETGYAPGFNSNFAPSHDEMDEFLAEHPCVQESIPVAERLRYSTGIRCSVGAWFIFVTSHDGTSVPHCLGSPVDGGSYLEGLISGANLEEGHPALTLRERLYKDPSYKKDALSLAAALVYSWNNYRRGTNSKIVKVTRTGENKLTAASFPPPADGWYPSVARARRETQGKRK